MIVLALDSTTPAGSVGLDAGTGDLDVREGDPSRTWSQRLPGDLLALLEHRGLSARDVDVFAVLAGPGSLTGLRVGIATMQGFAFATGKPVVAVSALDALAEHALDAVGAPDGHTWYAAWRNAMRGEVFAGLYTVAAPADSALASGDPLETIDGPLVDTPTVAADRLVNHLGSRRLVVAGDADPLVLGPLADRLGDRLQVLPCPVVVPTLIRMARRLAAAGRGVSPHAVHPLYVRKPDVVLTRERGAAAAGGPAA